MSDDDGDIRVRSAGEANPGGRSGRVTLQGATPVLAAAIVSLSPVSAAGADTANLSPSAEASGFVVSTEGSRQAGEAEFRFYPPLPELDSTAPLAAQIEEAYSSLRQLLSRPRTSTTERNLDRRFRELRALQAKEASQVRRNFERHTGLSMTAGREAIEHFEDLIGRLEAGE